MKARLISVLLVIALLVTVGVITAQAAIVSGKTGYPNQDNLTFLNNVHNTKLDFTTSNSHVCPFCGGSAVEWTQLTAADAKLTKNTSTPNKDSSITAGHYYVTGTVDIGSNTIGLYKNGTKSVVIPGTEGKVTTSVSYCIYLAKDSVITGSSTIFKSANATSYGVNIMGEGELKTTGDKPVIISSAQELRLMGGTYTPMAGATAATITSLSGASTGTKGIFVMEGAKINGTLAPIQASSYLIGGEIERVELPAVGKVGSTDNKNYMARAYHAKSSSGAFAAYGGLPEIGGTVKIGELVTERPLYVDMLAAGAEINVAGETPFQLSYPLQGVETADAATAIADCFKAVDNTQYEVVQQVESDKYYLQYKIKDTVVTCPQCEKAYDGEWIPVTQDTLTSTELSAGHYKLEGDLNLTAPLKVSNDICVDLNGKNITSSGRVLEQSGGKLIIFGNSGTITGKATEGDASTIAVTGGELVLKTGTFKHEGTDLTTMVISGATVTMTDGVVFTSARATNSETGEIVTEGTVYGRHVWLKNSTSTFNMQGGTIENGIVVRNGNGSYQGGGNIYVTNGALNVTGGTIQNGQANISGAHGGGNILGLRGTLKLHNVTISGGKAVGGQGGNVMSVMTGIDISEALISGGRADMGGNVVIRNPQAAPVSGANQIYDTIITEGRATSYGGNLAYLGTTHADKPILKISGGKLTNGVSNGYGGNFYTSASAMCDIYVLRSTEFTGGQAEDGGNIFLGGTGQMQIIAAKINTGTAKHGALIYQKGGKLIVHDGEYNSVNCTIQESNGGKGFYIRNGEITLAGGKFTSESAEEPGQAIYLAQANVNDEISAPKLILDEVTSAHSSWHGNLVIADGDAARAIALNNNKCALEVDASWKHNVTLFFKANNSVAPNGFIANSTATGDAAWSGHVYVSSIVGTPEVENRDGKLYVATGKDADDNWVNAQAKIDAGEDVVVHGGTLALTTDEANIKLANGASVSTNLNGNSANVSVVEGEGNTAIFYGYNDNTENHGTATLGAGVIGPEGPKSATWYKDGYYVVALEAGENTYNYHKLEMTMKSISLRPSAAGLYYTSVIKTDSVLEEMIESAGILLGTAQGTGIETLATAMKDATAADMANPDAPFTSVAPAKDKLNLNEVTSVLVKNIFTEKIELTDENGVVTDVIEGRENTKQHNAARGAISVVGTPYVAFKDDSVLVCQNAKDCSMQQYLMMADEQLADDAEKLPKVKAFCDSWFVNDFGWTLPHIYPAPPASEETV